MRSTEPVEARLYPPIPSDDPAFSSRFLDPCYIAMGQERDLANAQAQMAHQSHKTSVGRGRKQPITIEITAKHPSGLGGGRLEEDTWGSVSSS
jgi:hypothetical protein